MSNLGTGRIDEKLQREFGPVIREALKDVSVVEIIVNPDGNIFIERLGAPMIAEGHLSPTQVESIIATLSSMFDEVINKENPTLACELPDGSRFQGWAPPVVLNHSFCIRKASVSVLPLVDYVEKKVMSETQMEALIEALKAHENILVVGGTGSGKTTMLNSIVSQLVELAPHERIITIEDTREIKLNTKNVLALKSVENMPIVGLVRTALRGRPDRVFVGEVRTGEAALELIKAWNTGHPGGITTIHANSAGDSLTRLELLISEELQGNMQRFISGAIHIVVSIQKAGNEAGRVIDEMVRVAGYDQITGKYIIEGIQ